MEVININGNRWRKTIGDEGQDVLVAEFMIDEDKVIGQFPSEKLYDLVIDKDTDLYLPSSGFSDDLSEDPWSDRQCVPSSGFQSSLQVTSAHRNRRCFRRHYR